MVANPLEKLPLEALKKMRESVLGADASEDGTMTLDKMNHRGNDVAIRAPKADVVAQLDRAIEMKTAGGKGTVL